MSNTVVWFDIPVSDLARATQFYSQILGVEMQPMENGPTKMSFFPFEPGSASGALVESSDNNPGTKGTLVYLNAGDDLSDPLGRVVDAGGKVLLDKTPIGEHGFIAHFLDSEGNKVALHSLK